jgi:type II secretory pathway predicted ATPase ExeA
MIRERTVFTDKAINLIHMHTQGFPRRISMFCHNALISMIRNQQKVVDENAVLELIRHEVNWNV